MIDRAQLHELAFVARVQAFLATRTEAERAMFQIGMSYHAARCHAADERRGQKLHPQDRRELDLFRDLEKRYGFDFTSPISDAELAQARKLAWEAGHAVHE